MRFFIQSTIYKENRRLIIIMKRTITESQLKKMIAESIKSTLNEIGDTEEQDNGC